MGWLQQLLEAHQADGDTAAVNSALLQLGQFRLQRHLADTSSGVELSFAQLEMTDMDLSGALEYFSAVCCMHVCEEHACGRHTFFGRSFCVIDTSQK